jgi:plastocyanin
MRTGCYGWSLAGLALLLGPLPVQANTVEVTIEKLVLKPATINAAVGDTILWVNKDVMAHTATVDGYFDVMIPPHQSASTVVTKTGTMDYYCRFHPNMRGRIDVQAK